MFTETEAAFYDAEHAILRGRNVPPMAQTISATRMILDRVDAKLRRLKQAFAAAALPIAANAESYGNTKLGS